MQMHYIKNNKELAKNMRFLRKCYGFTQQKVAKSMGITRSSYSYYESGRVLPDLYALIKLCEFYDIELADLVTKEGVQKVRIDLDSASNGEKKSR